MFSFFVWLKKKTQAAVVKVAIAHWLRSYITFRVSVCRTGASCKIEMGKKVHAGPSNMWCLLGRQSPRLLDGGETTAGLAAAKLRRNRSSLTISNGFQQVCAPDKTPLLNVPDVAARQWGARTTVLRAAFGGATSANRSAIVNKKRCFHAASVDGFSRCAQQEPSAADAGLLQEKRISLICLNVLKASCILFPLCAQWTFQMRAAALRPRCLPTARQIAASPTIINARLQLAAFKDGKTVWHHFFKLQTQALHSAQV